MFPLFFEEGEVVENLEKNDTGFPEALRQRIPNAVENAGKIGFLRLFVRGFVTLHRRMRRLVHAQCWFPCATVYIFRACSAQVLPKYAPSVACTAQALPECDTFGFAEGCYFAFLLVGACWNEAQHNSEVTLFFSYYCVQGTKTFPVYFNLGGPVWSIDDTELYHLQGHHIQ